MPGTSENSRRIRVQVDCLARPTTKDGEMDGDLQRGRRVSDGTRARYVVLGESDDRGRSEPPMAARIGVGRAATPTESLGVNQARRCWRGRGTAPTRIIQ